MAKPERARKTDPGQPTSSPFQCSICGQTFDPEDELLAHERTHMGEQVGATGTSDEASAENAGMLTGAGNEPLPFARERRRWTTGSGDREEGEMTGRETPGGRDVGGFSGDAGLEMDRGK